MVILGIETSCDETAASVVEITDKGNLRLLSNVVFSSMDLHAAYGGVVPEIAARSHIESIIPVIVQALDEAFFLKNAERGERREESGEKVSATQTPHSSLLTPQSDLWDQIDGIAVTYGAGLSGSLLIGVMTARTLAIAKNKPLYAINHVEGHIYANFITEAAPPRREEREEMREKAPGSNPSLRTPIYSLPAAMPRFPMLGLIVSGGHSQLALWRDHFDYTLLGQTQDDAIGEAFDKVAKIIGLPYPGGPSVSTAAQKGDAYAFNFPKAKMTTVSPGLVALRSKEQPVRQAHCKQAQGKRSKNNGKDLSAHSSLLTALRSNSYDFSFSGIKTAVLRAAQKAIGETHEFPSQGLPERLSEAQKANIAASFQRVAVETVVDKTVLACEEFRPASVVIGGGVASSMELRRQLAERIPLPIEYTDPKLCTDNGAMIAALGCYHAALGKPQADPYVLDVQPNLSM